MIKHQEHRFTPYTSEQMMKLVLDVDRYAEFLPWCRASRVIESKNNNAFTAELLVGFVQLNYRYISLVESDYTNQSITVTAISGPFRHLVNNWKFITQPLGCEIVFVIEFSFKSSMLQKIVNRAFHRVCTNMAAAFEQRAQDIYGTKPIPASLITDS